MSEPIASAVDISSAVVVTKKPRLPPWLHRKISNGIPDDTRAVLDTLGLNTVCEEAACPNRGECYTKKTATFLALGKQCTRSCSFCCIDFSKAPPPPDPLEPMKIAKAADALGLKHVVVTMVARDDLSDHGAGHLVKIMESLRARALMGTIELLTSDFSGNWSAIDKVLSRAPDLFNHNIETVKRLSPKVRHKASYDRSLAVLRYVVQSGVSLVKSGLMVGLGEKVEEVEEALYDLANAGCTAVTIGQFLSPSSRKWAVREFITPEQFEAYRIFGERLGLEVYSAPYVRSSYNAASLYERLLARKERLKK